MFSGNRDFAVGDLRKVELTLENESRKCFRMYKTILEIMDYRQYAVSE
jgi:hypothetical protein